MTRVIELPKTNPSLKAFSQTSEKDYVARINLSRQCHISDSLESLELKLKEIESSVHFLSRNEQKNTLSSLILHFYRTYNEITKILGEASTVDEKSANVYMDEIDDRIGQLHNQMIIIENSIFNLGEKIC